MEISIQSVYEKNVKLIEKQDNFWKRKGLVNYIQVKIERKNSFVGIKVRLGLLEKDYSYTIKLGFLSGLSDMKKWLNGSMQVLEKKTQSCFSNAKSKTISNIGALHVEEDSYTYDS